MSGLGVFPSGPFTFVGEPCARSDDGDPASPEARLFYRCGHRRFADARILLAAGKDHTTGAVYLADYGIECMLKALLLATLSPAARLAMLTSFRGAKAHDLESLRTRYLQSGGARFPPEVNKALTLVSVWSTDLRYLPKTLKTEEAVGFVKAAEQILLWADGRL